MLCYSWLYLCWFLCACEYVLLVWFTWPAILVIFIWPAGRKIESDVFHIFFYLPPGHPTQWICSAICVCFIFVWMLCSLFWVDELPELSAGRPASNSARLGPSQVGRRPNFTWAREYVCTFNLTYDCSFQLGGWLLWVPWQGWRIPYSWSRFPILARGVGFLRTAPTFGWFVLRHRTPLPTYS